MRKNLNKVNAIEGATANLLLLLLIFFHKIIKRIALNYAFLIIDENFLVTNFVYKYNFFVY